MASNVPLTIQTGTTGALDSMIIFGSNKLDLGPSKPNLYWAVLIDRTNLKIVQNFTFSDNQSVPAQLQPYLSNPQYILILNTQRIYSNNLPAGNFYKMLMSVGAGSELMRLEQIFAALNCSNWGFMGYVLVTVMDTTDGFEFASYSGPNMVSTLQLVPTQVGSGVLYTPSPLK
jgi:hypothetical protein